MTLLKLYIYILLLKNNKYYIGITDNVDRRIEQHKSLTGSEWTKLNPFIKVLEVLEVVSRFDEEKYTLIYMDKYGINNVRGASYSQVQLFKEQKIQIVRSIRNSTDKCMRCGSKDHFVSDCKSSWTITPSELNGPQVEPIPEEKSLLGKRKEREFDQPIDERPTKKPKND